MGPLSLLWTEADRIKKEGQDTDPADVIPLAQRAIVLTGNAHYIFNYDRRKAVLAKTMPDNLDFLSEKKCQKALSKSNGQLLGKKFLKVLAKENKELKEMLFSSINKKKYNGKHYNNRRNDQFFLQGPTHVLQSMDSHMHLDRSLRRLRLDPSTGIQEFLTQCPAPAPKQKINLVGGLLRPKSWPKDPEKLHLPEGWVVAVGVYPKHAIDFGDYYFDRLSNLWTPLL